MTRKTNPFGKTRKPSEPYAVFRSPCGTFTWCILKTYQRPDLEAKNQYARWFVAASGPGTFGGFDMGDTYRREVQAHGYCIAAEPEWIEAYGHAPNLKTPAEYLAKA